ncbi:DUF979 domain-containing protein [Gallaecimonas sp. GXIMD1310]|uniref:DUF979 domain-containing protein n=1 Tax=Gallaecimonas sp. GXIMD1310 TaxID=3131926 RepID=UPI00325639AE
MTVTFFYWLAGLLLLANALLTLKDSAHPKRWSSALFWALFGALFIVSDWLPATVTGVLVLIMALLGGLNWVSAGQAPEEEPKQRQQRATLLGHRLFWPALTIPLLTLVGSLLLPWLDQQGLHWVPARQATLVSLGLACVLAFVLALKLTRESLGQGLKENRRLTDAVGWPMLLPQMLAVLGILFAHAGVGDAVAAIAKSLLPEDMRLAVIIAYGVGMALFTMIMGNAFAAFPVMTAGIGIPFLVDQYHADPAIMAAIGMFSGYCGTLMTPMAANFNVVPAALLELDDRHGVIKAQIPTALMLLLANIVLMWWLL